MTTPHTTPTALALSLAMEFDRSKLGAKEHFARLIISVPQQAQIANAARRGLALAIALDTSGSMEEDAGSPDGSPMSFSIPRLGMHSGKPKNSKIERCKAAIWEAVNLLGDDDMASLTAFSSMAMTLFPMSAMTSQNKAKFKTALDKLAASGGTALHAGWSEAGREAAKGIDRKLLCRVALLTDGEATDGERNPEALAKQSATLANLGVSTSCFGVGARFNEDLMVAMADAGEGNFRYIPDAMLASAAAIDEVNGLGATAGRKAKMRIVSDEGVASIELLNPFDKLADGWVKLPTLLAGRPIEAVAKFTLAEGASLATVRAEVSWENRDGIEQSAQAQLSAEVVSLEQSEASARNVEVAGSATALMAATAKTTMAHMISAGNIAGANACLESTRTLLSSSAHYSGSVSEMASLDALSASMSSGDFHSARKSAVFQSYTRSKNQTVPDLPIVDKQEEATKP
jgi:Ca-activated chloride channel family protein